jgi:acetyltransferase-like isoleucine patch superfamily enzyme
MIFKLLFKLYKGVVYKIIAPFYNKLLFNAHKVQIVRPWKINGFIYVENNRSSIAIGKHFSVNTSFFYNNIGRQHSTSLIAELGGRLKIGNNVGISSSTIVCHQEVEIQDNVRIGGNCVIYDTDFHSTNAASRAALVENKSETKTAKVTICKNAFIGAHSTILKGTFIGENSIIGAGSVVAGSKIPANEIWGGNPARFIKVITSDKT